MYSLPHWTGRVSSSALSLQRLLLLLSCLSALVAAQPLMDPITPGTVRWLYQPGTNTKVFAARASPRTSNVYFSDWLACKVFVLDGATGQRSVFAGAGTCSCTGDDSSAMDATVNSVSAISIDPVTDDVYIADFACHTIRKISNATGTISLVAGTPGVSGSSGNGGLATSATINSPYGVAVSLDGMKVYLQESNVIRMVDVTTGIITAYAGTGATGSAGDGGPATSATLNNPRKMTVHPFTGDLLFADNSNNKIRVISASTQVITTFAGTGGAGSGGDTGHCMSAQFNGPWDVDVDHTTGDVYVMDANNNKVRRISAFSRKITTVLGVGSVFAGDAMYDTASLGTTRGLALSRNASKNIFICNQDTTGGLRVMYKPPNWLVNDRNGTVVTFPNSTLVSGATSFTGSNYAFMPNAPTEVEISTLSGDTYVIDSAQTIHKIRRWTGQVTIFASFSTPSVLEALAVHPVTDDVYVSDRGRHVVWKIEQSTGTVSVVAGTLDTATGGPGTNGVAATSDTLNTPFGLAFPPGGIYLYISVMNSNCIKKLSLADGLLYDAAGTTCSTTTVGAIGIPRRLAHGPGMNRGPPPWTGPGVLYVATYSFYGVVMAVNLSTNEVTRVAGNGNYLWNGEGVLATATGVNPHDIAVSQRTGDLYIASPDWQVVLRVSSTSGKLWIVSGIISGTGSNGDLGIATSARYNFVAAVAVTDAHLLVADKNNNRIRATAMLGQYVDSCSGGYYNDPAAQGLACLACPTGSSAGSLYSCTDGLIYGCGTYNPGSKWDYVRYECDRCSVATYADTTGQSVCNDCLQLGQTTASTGSISAAQCSFASGYTTPLIYSFSYYQETINVKNSRVSGEFWLYGNWLLSGTVMPFNGYRTPHSALQRYSASKTLLQRWGMSENVFGNVGYPLSIDPVRGDVFRWEGANGVQKIVYGSSSAVISSGSKLPFPQVISKDGFNWYNFTSNRVVAYNVFEPLDVSPWYQATVLAGTGIPGYVDGPAQGAQFSSLGGMAMDRTETLVYILDSNRVRLLNRTSGTVSTVAGTGTASDTGDNGPAVSAGINCNSIVVSSITNDVYLGCYARIRKIQVATGVITTVAGTGVEPDWNSGITSSNALAVKLNAEYLDYVPSSGSLIFRDRNRFRIVTAVDTNPGIHCQAGTFYDRSGTLQCVTCGAGTYSPYAGVLDECLKCPPGTFSTAVGATSISTCTACPTGTSSNLGASSSSGCFSCPFGTFADTVTGVCMKCPLGRFGNITGLSATCYPCPAGSTTAVRGAQSCDVCSSGTYSAAPASPSCTACPRSSYADSLGSTTCTACPSWLTQTTLNAGTNSLGGCVAIPDGTVKTFPTPTATFNGLQGIARSPKTGHIYVTEYNIRKITRVDPVTGARVTFAGSGAAAGCPQNGSLAASAPFQTVFGLAVHPVTDDVYIADAGCQRVYRVAADTGILTFAAGSGVYGSTGNGGPATSANIHVASGIDFSLDGRYLYIVSSQCIRRVDLQNNSVISTYAGHCEAGGYAGDGAVVDTATTRFNNLQFITVSPVDGTIFVADYGNGRVRSIDPKTQVISTITVLAGAYRIAVSPVTGDLAVTGSNQVYTVSARWGYVGATFPVFAGSDAGAGTGDGGPVSEARLNNARDIMYAPNGDLYIGDSSASRIRIVWGHGKKRYPDWAVTGIPKFTKFHLVPVAAYSQIKGIQCSTKTPDICYFVFNSAVYRMKFSLENNPASTTITVFMGTPGSSAGGTACTAGYPKPHASVLLNSETASVAVHPITDDVYVADPGCGRIFWANVTNGTSSIFNPVSGSFSGSAGPVATKAFSAAYIAFAPDGGTMYVGTPQSLLLRVNMTAMTVGQVPGGSFPSVPSVLSVSKINGDLFFSVGVNNVYKYRPSTGVLSVFYNQLVRADGIAEDPRTGDVYVADSNAQVVYRLANGTLAKTSISTPTHRDVSGMCINARGDLMIAQYGGNGGAVTAEGTVALQSIVLNDQPFEEPEEPVAPYYPAPEGIIYNSVEMYVQTRRLSPFNFSSPRGMVLIPGTSMLLVADADAQTISLVNMHNSTVTLVAGNASSRKDCYAAVEDPHAAASSNCSFKDGFGAAAEFASPYSVKLHSAHQRYALVVDTVNGALRVVDLYNSGKVWTALTGLGFPTDVVSFDGDRVVVTDALNHKLWIYTGATLSVLQSEQPWPTTDNKLRVLVGGAGQGYPGQYAEGDALTAKFWEPMGVAYDSGRRLLYVADYRNRVIRSVDPATGSTALLGGNQAQAVGLYTDSPSGNSSGALITGPTSLVYDEQRDVLYFTDRRVSTDPADDTGSIRSVHLGTGIVKTVAGKQTRRPPSVDGTVDAPLVGASSAWGLGISETGWVVWVEADTHELRIAVPTRKSRIASKIPCQPGYFLSTKLSKCTQCNGSNWLPYTDVGYINEGAIDGGNTCRYVFRFCFTNFYEKTHWCREVPCAAVVLGRYSLAPSWSVPSGLSDKGPHTRNLQRQCCWLCHCSGECRLLMSS